jgi:hypothetical protein
MIQRMAFYSGATIFLEAPHQNLTSALDGAVSNLSFLGQNRMDNLVKAHG